MKCHHLKMSQKTGVWQVVKLFYFYCKGKKKKPKVTKLTSAHSDARCLFLSLCIQIEQSQSLILYTIERRSVTIKFEKFLCNQTRELGFFLLWVSSFFGTSSLLYTMSLYSGHGPCRVHPDSELRLLCYLLIQAQILTCICVFA